MYTNTYTVLRGTNWSKAATECEQRPYDSEILKVKLILMNLCIFKFTTPWLTAPTHCMSGVNHVMCIIAVNTFATAIYFTTTLNLEHANTSCLTTIPSHCHALMDYLQWRQCQLDKSTQRMVNTSCQRWVYTIPKDQPPEWLHCLRAYGGHFQVQQCEESIGEIHFCKSLKL